MTAGRIFITGASSGIGATTVRLFADRGWEVGALARREGLLESLKQSCPDGSVTIYVADVRDAAAMEASIDEFAAAGDGRLDAVFANAGVLFMGDHEEISGKSKALLIDVNTKGVLNTIDPAFPYLRDTDGAHLVAMSSSSAEYGLPQHAVYGATKFWVRGLTEALNIEYKKQDIQVSAVYVGYVNTPMIHDAKVKPNSVEKMGVKVESEEVAETVWKAVHGNKSHWRVGKDATLIHNTARLLGARMAGLLPKLMGV